MQMDRDQALESAAVLKKHLKGKPQVGILTGTGLGDCVASIDLRASLAYETIPHFPASTVVSHPGHLLIGQVQISRMMIL